MADSSTGPEQKTRWQRARPHLLAAAVLFHVVASTLSVLPDPARGLDRRNWKEARVAAELRAWSVRLGMEQPALEALLYDLGLSARAARDTLLLPFRPYMRATGQLQTWSMFAAGARRAHRFGIFVRDCEVEDRACGWEPLYVHGESKYAWRAEQLANPRTRSGIFGWTWPKSKASYQRGCVALARRAFADRPALRAVECRFAAQAVRSPDNPEPPRRRWERPLLVTRKSLPPLEAP